MTKEGYQGVPEHILRAAAGPVHGGYATLEETMRYVAKPVAAAFRAVGLSPEGTQLTEEQRLERVSEVAQEFSERTFTPSSITFMEEGEILPAFHLSWRGEGPQGWVESMYTWMHNGKSNLVKPQPAPIPGLEMRPMTISDATFAFEVIKNGVNSRIGAVVLWPGYNVGFISNIMLRAEQG
ncbi:MAG TPA: hypothetical protein VL989_03330 [Candidatus Sulfotelmatobacter sp.]|nr:hypothetical protein [Candidatus Sulfotelmatobacter sp.]